ncbi:DUF6069 family protein [Pseudonocardia xinjiangensis]|uniref:DUF6069 family protein n=1 Tax=Pseudonocardia xinjiangensis TaxID=75289 RepID=UPI0031E0401B
MAGYHDETDPFGSRGRPPQSSVRVDVSRLWVGGLATAAVAALIGLLGVLIVRAVLGIALHAPSTAGPFGDSDTVVLCGLAAVAALAVTGLAHLLLIGAPRPMDRFASLVGLLIAMPVVVPFLSPGPMSVALATAAIHLVIGLVIGTLVSGAAPAAVRPAPQRQRFEFE